MCLPRPTLNSKYSHESTLCLLLKFGHAHLQESGCVRIEIDDKNKPGVI